MNYTFHANRTEDGLWYLEAPGHPRNLWAIAKTLEEAPFSAREAVALKLDVPLEDVEVTIVTGA